MHARHTKPILSINVKFSSSLHSDKHITEHSGFLNNIFPGDLILADRGFDIQDSVGLKFPHSQRENLSWHQLTWKQLARLHMLEYM
jgi:hypothetical protein